MNIDLIKQKAGIIGESDAINQVLEMVAQVANVDISVLINGESGTGKELVSKALHLGSKRASSELVIVNCGAIPEGIIESELFGHKKGAYTDAADSRKGYFETANKGTIFLDEIGDMPLETQVKVLRVLESGEFMRVGDSVTKKTDVRVIAATNKDLAKLVQEGKFRQDLYYRLKTVTINIPPLRKRANDIRLLVDRVDVYSDTLRTSLLGSFEFFTVNIDNIFSPDIIHVDTFSLEHTIYAVPRMDSLPDGDFSDLTYSLTSFPVASGVATNYNIPGQIEIGDRFEAIELIMSFQTQHWIQYGYGQIASTTIFNDLNQEIKGGFFLKTPERYTAQGDTVYLEYRPRD